MVRDTGKIVIYPIYKRFYNNGIPNELMIPHVVVYFHQKNSWFVSTIYWGWCVLVQQFCYRNNVFCCFYLVLYLISPKLEEFWIFPISNKCNLAFSNPNLKFLFYPWTVSWVSLYSSCWKKSINGHVKFKHQFIAFFLHKTKHLIQGSNPFIASTTQGHTTHCSSCRVF
jgi:hypothetical protein